MKIPKKISRIFPLCIILFSSMLYAQKDIAVVSTNDRSILYSEEKPTEWTYLCSTGDLIFSIDKNSFVRTDSANFKLLVKEVPNSAFYPQIKSDKMREHRVLEDYSDRSHVKYDYAGYENYAYTVREKEINGKEKRYRILKTMDYDLNGSLLDMRQVEKPEWRSAIGMLPESFIIDSMQVLPAGYYTGASLK